ncbi:MAG: hypothetical protein K1X74_15455 [Pirellulales bacterium]|nr:hypothetical protein [Pirellulales bacterium]
MSCRISWLAVSLCALSVGTAEGQLPTIRLSNVFPPGGRQGTQVDFSIAGVDLDAVGRLSFTHPGIAAVAKTKPVEGQPQPQPVPNEFTVTIAADVPPGVYEVRAIGLYGSSNPRRFVVSAAPESVEVEPNDAQAQSTTTALETVIHGRFAAARDIDWLQFPATAGQTVIAEVLAERIDSRADVALELYNAAGQMLGNSRDRVGLDSLVAVKIPADGTYFLRLYDFAYGGSPDHVWRLVLTAGPHVEAVFPNVVTQNTTATVQLIGHNLPGSQVIAQLPQGEALEALASSITAPADPVGIADQAHSFVRGAGTALDWLTASLPVGTASVSATVNTSPWPVLVEAEPNNDPAAPQTLTTPVEVAGQFSPRGDVDYFTFAAQKDAVFWIETIAERAGSPADPFVMLQRLATNDKQETTAIDLQEIDDTPVRADSVLAGAASRDGVFRFVAPETATYRLQVRDLYGESRGDPRLTYRLVVRPETPDFRLVALPMFLVPQPWGAIVRRGGHTPLMIEALRKDGFAGPIELSVEGLPPGITCPPAIIGTGRDGAPLVFTATEDCADFAGPIRIVGRAKIGEADVVRECREATTLVAGAPVPAQWTRLAQDHAVAVGPLAPLRVSTSATSAQLVQGQRFEVPIEIARREGFAGAVTLVASLPPKPLEGQIAVADAQTSATFPAQLPADFPPGTYSLYIVGTAKVPSPRKDDKGNVIAVDTVEVTTPIVLQVAPGPLVLAPEVPGGGAVKQGAAIDVPVKLTRRNEFAGPVTLDLVLPAGVAGIQAAEVVVPADQAAGTLHIAAAADATEGTHAHVAVRARMEFAGRMVEVHQPIPLVVQK